MDKDDDELLSRWCNRTEDRSMINDPREISASKQADPKYQKHKLISHAILI